MIENERRNVDIYVPLLLFAVTCVVVVWVTGRNNTSTLSVSLLLLLLLHALTMTLFAGHRMNRRGI